MKNRFQKTAILAAAISATICGAVAIAQPTTKRAVTTTNTSIPAGSMTAYVEEVHGNVRVRMTAKDPWKPATVGLELPEGAEIQTSIRSSVRCSIPPDQFFVLDRVTTVRIGQALSDGAGKVRTDLQMKYGRTQFQIEAAGLEHQATISSPGSTLAIRGTDVALENEAPFAPVATSYTGKARFTTNNRQVSVGSAGGSRVVTDAGARDAADAALVASVIDPKYAGARTASESKLIANEQARGATFGFDTTANIPIIVNGPGPVQNEQQLISELPGRLDFVARWTGNTDINLEVFSAHGDPAHLISKVFATQPFTPDEFLYPGFNLNHTPTGGTEAFDDRGGPHGGQEIAYWTNNVPKGVYNIVAFNVSGKPTPIEINAYLDGKRLSLYDFTKLAQFTTDPTAPGSSPRTTDFKGTVPYTQPPIVVRAPDGTVLFTVPGATLDFRFFTVFVPGYAPFENQYPDASQQTATAAVKNSPAAPPTIAAKTPKPIKESLFNPAKLSQASKSTRGR